MNNQQIAHEIAALLATNGIIPPGDDDQLEMSIVPTYVVRGETKQQCSSVKWAQLNIAAARLCLANWDRAITVDLNDIRMKGADKALLDAVMHEMQQSLSADIDEALRALYRGERAA